jgi:hypothetical protein
MAEDVLQAIIKQAETLDPEEKIRLAHSLELMITRFFPAGLIAESLEKMQVYQG